MLKLQQYTITLPPFPQGLHLITEYVKQAIEPLPKEGLLHLFLQHTSAALTINESYDPDVRKDLEAALKRLVPESEDLYVHLVEGLDDAPAHVKTALIGVQLWIPIRNHALALGRWQGIYLWEFRKNAYARTIIATMLAS